ncbi:ABC transporter ATP-binding protein [Halovulum sp. GXIMD14793]
MIKFDNVSKSFWTGRQRKVILDRATFSVELGNSMGILAPNGTGKTTLVNMMAGLEKPDEGRITRTSRISFPLGTVAGVQRKQSAKENVRYISRLYDNDPDETEAFCRHLAGIGEYFEMPLATYSSGMRSRFTFALMLSLDFDIYLIDEGLPTSFDRAFSRRAAGILEERLHNGTVVMVSHQAKTLEKYCSSAAVLRDGQLYTFDRLEDAKEMYDYD